MTKAECENMILGKLIEIAAIARTYNPRAHHISMYVIGSSAQVCCMDDDTDEYILDAHNGRFDSEEGESDA